MLGLTFDNEADYDKIKEDDTFNFIDLNELLRLKKICTYENNSTDQKKIILCHPYKSSHEIKGVNASRSLIVTNF